jgi:hypothetical protein
MSFMISSHVASASWNGHSESDEASANEQPQGLGVGFGGSVPVKLTVSFDRRLLVSGENKPADSSRQVSDAR